MDECVEVLMERMPTKPTGLGELQLKIVKLFMSTAHEIFERRNAVISASMIDALDAKLTALLVECRLPDDHVVDVEFCDRVAVKLIALETRIVNETRERKCELRVDAVLEILNADVGFVTRYISDGQKQGPSHSKNPHY
ncbi:unnamed protein product [Caenorhabditis bovis]|uniref:Uncharacterized protein n=1 Tax=Caenorhabditis bovis TaxID=2654633 RepID=A0A8S1EIS2_9PELO|nr:unnamed protein product [Caenorhabditis bovis]